MIFVVLALAVWRLSSLLAREEGPFCIFDKIRLRLGVRYDQNSEAYGTNNISKGLICVWCNSIWVGFVASFIVSNTIEDVIINTLALSAAAIIIEEKL